MASHYMSALSSQNNPGMDYSITSSGSMTVTGSPDIDINSNINDEFLSTLDPTNDIANDILVNQSFDYSTSNTTPEFLLPPKNEYLMNSHVLSENYSYSFPSDDETSHHHHSLSLPIDQLNLLSLKPLSSHNSQLLKLPSPEFTHAYIRDVQFDDRTINPKQLYSKQPPTLKSAKKSASNTNLSGLAVSDKYILPSSSLSPNLLSFFNANLNKFDFQMNNECLDAISCWLTSNQTNDNKEVIVNPTGIIKNTCAKRRNSIQLTTPAYVPDALVLASPSGIQKRKRRKSYNYGYRPEADISEIKNAVNSDISNIHNDSASSLVSITPKEKFPPISLPLEQEEGKPFPCPECSKQFKRSEHLKRHIRSVHSNIRPFHCKYCEKQFSRSDNLAQHLKTHYKVNSNGTTTIIYGNPNLHNRGGRRKNTAESAPQTMA